MAKIQKPTPTQLKIFLLVQKTLLDRYHGDLKGEEYVYHSESEAELSIEWKLLEKYKDIEKVLNPEEVINSKDVEALDELVLTLWPNQKQELKRPELLAKDASFHDAWSNGPISNNVAIDVITFGVAIGIPEGQATHVLDSIFQARFTFHAFSKPAENIAAFIDKYSGIYHIYRHDYLNSDDDPSDAGILIRCSMSIRYAVPYDRFQIEQSGREETEYQRVRCKLFVPKLSDYIKNKSKSDSRRALGVEAPGAHQYDGYVIPCSSSSTGDLIGKNAGELWQWLFQQRDELENHSDILVMYTESFCNHGIVFGDLLTQHQHKKNRSLRNINTRIIVTRDTRYRFKWREAEDADSNTKLDTAYPQLQMTGENEDDDLSEHKVLNESVAVFALGTNLDKFNEDRLSEISDLEEPVLKALIAQMK